MLNMSNQFYSYISTLILNHFNDSGIRPGDRFSLQLDKKEEVDCIVKSLQQNDSFPPEKFIYHVEYDIYYRTFLIPLSKSRLIVAYPSKYVKSDFLVTLRNLVGEQKGEFKNTSLISIVDEELDSIQGGSSDLQKDGMPLHPKVINSNLQDEIKDSGLTKVDKHILSDALNELMRDREFEEITFFDFEDIFITLKQGYINDKDYHKFGLFKDQDLSTYSGNSFIERMKKNRELFESVKNVHDYGLGNDELEKIFSPEGARALIKESWIDKDFTEVHKYHRDFEQRNKELKVELNSIKVLGGLKYWRKFQNENTKPGQRKNHIIIFNDGRKEINIQASFGFQGDITSLSKEYMKQHGDQRTQAEVKNTNIFITINTDGDEAPRTQIRYQHNNRVALGAELNIIVVPFDEIFLESFKTRYLVNPKTGIELQFEDEELTFGDKLLDKTVEVSQNNQKVNITSENRLVLSFLPESFNEDDKLTLSLFYNNILVPLIFINELPESTPIAGQRIWKLVRETGEDMQWIAENNRLILGSREYYFHSQYRQYFEWELQWLQHDLLSGRFKAGELKKTNIEISHKLRERYDDLLHYFKSHEFENAIPSLCYVSDELYTIANSYIQQYCNEVANFSAGRPAGKKGLDLFKLGVIYSEDEIFLTPFHPLLVAYKLKAYELLKTEDLDNSILNRLNPEALIPFIYDEKDQLYKPDPQQDAMDWIRLKSVSEVSVSDSSNYLAKVVTDKLSQFKDHFSYLFIDGSLAPLLINVININNDLEILRGILKWMISKIHENGLQFINPIELTLYQSKQSDSSFELFSTLDSLERIEELFNLRFRKGNELEGEDVLNVIRENLVFYKQVESNNFKYAHISFYNMHIEEADAIQPMNSIDTGIAIDGLYTSVPSMRENESYVSGFGLRSYSNYYQNYLLNVAYYVNELAVNCKNDGNNSYRKGEAIFSRVSNTNESLLRKILESSNWVTFIDPHIDLDFFNSYEELLVIHYSDQYSSSNKYDAITVTDKSSQYFSVIKGFLNAKGVESDSYNIDAAIKAFNTFNGEWLLRIIGSKGYYGREKLSIISAIKYTLSYFDHSNILWVPISMEEVLRVAGVVGLNKNGGVFTARNLGISGSYSDDLLLIGLEDVDDDLKLHFYPIEVKSGYNKKPVIDKGKKQVLNTKNNIINQLTGSNGETFAGRFYRNFFVQLFLANAKKIEQNNIWQCKDYNISDKIVQKLLQDQYKIGDNLRDYIGDGAIVSFQKNAFYRSAELEDGILLLQFIKKDGYQGLINTSAEINKWLHSGTSDFIYEDMLAHLYRVGQSKTRPKSKKITRDGSSITKEINDSTDGKSLDNTELTRDSGDSKLQNKRYIIKEPYEHEGLGESKSFEPSENLDLMNVRIKIGTAKNSQKEIFWEYGNKDLDNRHLLISGGSGQGKTYFMQCILLELSKVGIPSIVIDYTEGFLPNQLEPEFKDLLGQNLIHKIVYNEKLPMNPFQQNVRDIGGIQLQESSTDVAERIRNIFASVYTSLGIQQLNAIYEAISNGVEKYGQNMNLLHLNDLLENDGSNYAKTALAQIRPLIDRNPFSQESVLNWQEILRSEGNVYILQLTGFQRDVQLLITEFILWDLWNYSVKNGYKDLPLPVIMDEAQNLDHSEASPSARILTEGRKFGWSAWYATQFLRSQLDASALSRLQMAGQKIYFSPPEQERSNIASTFANDNKERKYWEGKLASLTKGQCIVHGPVLMPNGELSSPIPTIVDISPLGDRI